MVRKLFVLFYIFLITKVTAGDRLCKPNEDILEGVCKLVTDCDYAVRSLKKTRTHPFRRCGFRGSLEVICCPLTMSTTTAESPHNLDTTTSTNLNYGETKTGGDVSSRRIAAKECDKIIASTIPPLGLHIIGGEMANPGEFPHMVGLGYNFTNGYRFICGGSLISNTFVLTAAHCTDNLERVQPSIVRIGEVDIGTSEFNNKTDIRIKEIIKHPEYLTKTKYHDLALLRLERPIEVSANVNALCLSTDESDPTTPLTITGWGTTNSTRDVKSTLLLKAKVSVVPTSICTKSYKNWLRLPKEITDEQICAGDPQGLQDACQGDSGGPLQSMSGADGFYRLVGITSFGSGCGSPIPGVYIRVAKYLDWIESVVWPNS